MTTAKRSTKQEKYSFEMVAVLLGVTWGSKYLDEYWIDQAEASRARSISPTASKESLLEISRYYQVHSRVTPLHARIAKEVIFSWQRQSALRAGRALVGWLTLTGSDALILPVAKHIATTALQGCQQWNAFHAETKPNRLAGYKLSRIGNISKYTNKEQVWDLRDSHSRNYEIQSSYVKTEFWHRNSKTARILASLITTRQGNSPW